MTPAEQLAKKINDELEDIDRRLYSRVTRLARAAMQEDSRLESFCMAMGSISFEVDCSWEEDGEKVERLEHLHPYDIKFSTPSLSELLVLMELVNERNISGRPARIDGPTAPLEIDW